MSDPLLSQDLSQVAPSSKQLGVGEASTQSSQASCATGATTTTTKKVRKKTTPRAPCWNHFTKYVTEEGENRAKCKYCETSYTMATTMGSTTNLNNHLKTCLKKPRGNTSDPKQSELTFVKASEEPVDLTTWVFNQDATRKALVQMIIVDELPFKIVEGEGFKYFVSIACPRFQIPSRWTIKRDCVDLFNAMKIQMRKSFSGDICRVCLTTDTWTSLQRVSYMVLTAHWIDEDWRLQKRIINFCPISSHRAESIGQALEKCIRDWGIQRIFTITVDNATANKGAIDYLIKKLNHQNSCVASGKHMQMRCIAHIINLIVQDGVKDASVSVDRVRAAVRYIRGSPSRLLKFDEMAEEENIDCKAKLCLDVPTRWNSTYKMLEVAEKYERAFEAYDMKDRNFHSDLEDGVGVPTFEDWEKVRRVAKVLEPFHELTLKASASLHVTSNDYIEILMDINALLNGLHDCGDLEIMAMASKMRMKFDRYWGDATKINLLMFMAVLLDPRCKKDFLTFGVEGLFPNVASEVVVDMVKKEAGVLFAEYCKEAEISSSGTSVSNPMQVDQSSVKVGLTKAKYFAKKQRVGLDYKSELDKYWSEENEVHNSSSFDILLWWKLNTPRFPILAKMALDILSIPISTVASESAFSTSGRVLDSFRSSLAPSTAEALVCTQDWFRNSKDPILVEEYAEESQNMEDGLSTIPEDQEAVLFAVLKLFFCWLTEPLSQQLISSVW